MAFSDSQQPWSQGSQSALEVINDRDVYGVMEETKNCYHLFNLQRYCTSEEMKRIGSGIRGSGAPPWVGVCGHVSPCSPVLTPSPCSPVLTPCPSVDPMFVSPCSPVLTPACKPMFPSVDPMFPSVDGIRGSGAHPGRGARGRVCVFTIRVCVSP